MQSTTPFTLLGLLAVFIWSCAVALSASATLQLGAFTAAGCNYLIASLALGVFFVARRELGHMVRGLRLRYFLLCSAFFAGHMLFFWLSLGMTSGTYQVAEVGIVNSQWSAFVVLFSLPILKRRVAGWFWLGLLVSSVGAIVPMAQSSGVNLGAFLAHLAENPWPYALMLMSVLSWGVYSNLTKRFEDGLNASAVLLTLALVGALLFCLGSVSGEPRAWNSKALTEVAFLGLGDALAFAGWDAAMRRGDQMLVVAASYATPVLSTVVTGLYLGVPLTAALWLGAGLVVAGAVVCRRSVL